MQTYFPTSPSAGLEKNKEIALSFLRSVQRPGIENLIKYLYDSDYFLAPASSSYHEAHPGGLCLHSLNLLQSFDEANKKMNKPLPFESVVFVPFSMTYVKLVHTSRLLKVMSL